MHLISTFSLSLSLSLPLFKLFVHYKPFMTLIGIMHLVILSLVIPSGLFSYWHWTTFRQRRNHEPQLEMLLAPSVIVKEMQHSTKRVTLRDVQALSAKTTVQSAKVAARVAVTNVLALLSERHQILNIINKHQGNFPRSDRVLMMLASLLSQLWVTGLFQNNGLIQAQWTCTPTSSGDLRWGGASNSTDWCSHCISAGHNSTSSMDKQECAELCVCELQDPETVYMIAHAIFVVLISGVPLGLLALLFTTGHTRLIEADELHVMVVLRKLDMAVDDFEKRKEMFVAVMADYLPASAQSFEQLIVCIRATMTMLKDDESEEGDVVSHKNAVSKKGRCIWTVFLRDSLQSIDNMLQTGSQQDRILAKVQHMLQLERVNPGIAWAMQDYELCKLQDGTKQPAAAVNTTDDWKKGEQKKTVGVTLVAVGYCIITAYIGVTSWYIMMFALQYGPSDARMWLRSFTTAFLVDMFLMNPLSIAFSAVFYLPVMKYIVQPLVDEAMVKQKESARRTLVKVLPTKSALARKISAKVIPTASSSTVQTPAGAGCMALGSSRLKENVPDPLRQLGPPSSAAVAPLEFPTDNPDAFGEDREGASVTSKILINLNFNLNPPPHPPTIRSRSTPAGFMLL
jgi:hypothetical protein